jgi:hypothetical protein
MTGVKGGVVNILWRDILALETLGMEVLGILLILLKCYYFGILYKCTVLQKFTMTIFIFLSFLFISFRPSPKFLWHANVPQHTSLKSQQ